MISEKSDSTQEITRSNDGLKWSEDETIDNSDDDDEDIDDVEIDEINDNEQHDDNKQSFNSDHVTETVRKVVKVIQKEKYKKLKNKSE